MSVLQPWVEVLPWKMQSVLIASMRGPDDRKTFEIKKLSRWLRITCQENADPSHTFMESELVPDIDYEALADELEYQSWHFMSHILYALEIVGYRHPSAEVYKFAFRLYRRIVHEAMHLVHEDLTAMNERLKDKVKHD